MEASKSLGFSLQGEKYFPNFGKRAFVIQAWLILKNIFEQMDGEFSAAILDRPAKLEPWFFETRALNADTNANRIGRNFWCP